MKRPQPQVPHLTVPPYGKEVAELDRFAGWLLWFQGGRKGPRPNVWAKVPEYAWKIQKEWALAHPKPKPPSSPPPPLPRPPASWVLGGPVVFTAWDSSAARSGPWLVAKIVQQGVAPLWSVGAGVIPQAETQGQVPVALGFFQSAPSSSKALVCTQGGWLPAKPFLDAGVNVAMVEAYQNEDPAHTPARLVWQAQHDGWPYVWPVVGCYHGYSLANYDLAPYGKSFGVYLAEEMSDADWVTLEKLCQ